MPALTLRKAPSPGLAELGVMADVVFTEGWPALEQFLQKLGIAFLALRGVTTSFCCLSYVMSEHIDHSGDEPLLSFLGPSCTGIPSLGLSEVKVLSSRWIFPGP